MEQTRVRLLKFKCDTDGCHFEFFINENNNVLTHHDKNLGALLDWRCPECEEGHLRYAATNSKFQYELLKKERAKQP